MEPLSERLSAVLFAVVEEHVETVEPVASRSVARRSGLELSSASVRHLMADLTERGLLAQPHVSAGRVPTEHAYRLWVDALLRDESPAVLTAESEYELSEAPTGVAPLLQRAADVLSRTTGQVGFYLGSPRDQIVLDAIRFVRVASERVMALVIARSGAVMTRVFEETDCDTRTLERVSAQLSEFVAGLTLAQARTRLAQAIEAERARSHQLQREVILLGWEGLARSDDIELYVGDRHGLLEQPEFSGDLDRLRDLLAALEEKERMMRLLDKVLRDGTSVAIGTEIEDPGIRECALVTATLGAPPGLGGLGVIGPVRMPYDRVIPTVRYVCERVSVVLC
jgi:heat-inducible transcriptional repressor